MAKVAQRMIIWQSDPILDDLGEAVLKRVRGVATDEPDTQRIEIGIDGVVPDIVPADVVAGWVKEGWVIEDPNRAAVAVPEGPPRVTLPPALTQTAEHARHAGRRIPPRPQQQED